MLLSMPLVIMLVRAWLYNWQCIDFAMAIALTIPVAIPVAMVFAFLLALSLAMQLVPKCYADIYSP